MRLWHKDLISILPNKQLIGQWRECCLIAKNIKEKGTPNHILVNKVMNYPIHHFIIYSFLVYKEMKNRGFNPNGMNFEKWLKFNESLIENKKSILFPDWHNDHYFLQCYYNLQEKYECGGISEEEWKKIEKLFEVKLFDNI